MNVTQNGVTVTPESIRTSRTKNFRSLPYLQTTNSIALVKQYCAVVSVIVLFSRQRIESKFTPTCEAFGRLALSLLESASLLRLTILLTHCSNSVESDNRIQPTATTFLQTWRHWVRGHIHRRMWLFEQSRVGFELCSKFVRIIRIVAIRTFELTVECTACIYVQITVHHRRLGQCHHAHIVPSNLVRRTL
jgi:hypothetical protein